MAHQPYGPPMEPGSAVGRTSLVDRLHDMGNGLLANMTPEQLAMLDELVPLPQLDTTQEALPEQTGGQRFFQGFAGLENQPQGPARGFGQGLIQGLSRGLGSAGSRIEAQRAQLEAGIKERQRARDLANQRATERYQTDIGANRRALALKMIELGQPTKASAITREDVAAFPGLTAGDIGKAWTDPAIQARVGNQRPSEKLPEPKMITREDVAAFPGLTGADIGKPFSNSDVQKRIGGQRPVAPVKPPSIFQARAAGFADQARNAIESIYPKGHTATSIEARIATLPARQQFGMRAPNVLQSDDMKAYNQAKLDFMAAITYQQSGATINPIEFDKMDKIYFVQPGDGLAEQKRKAKARERKIQEIAKQGQTVTLTPENDPEYQAYLNAQAAP